MVKEITRTNEFVERKRSFLLSKKVQIKNINIDDLKAFIGILLYTSIYKSNTEDLYYMFGNKASARNIFKSAMSGRIFHEFLYCVRLDNAAARNNLIANGKADAALSK